MSPYKRFSDHRGHLTEIDYDPERGNFTQVAVPHPFLAELSKGDAAGPVVDTPTVEEEPRTAGLTLEYGPPRRKFSASIDRILDQTEARIRAAHSTHLGYPYNLVGKPPLPESFDGFLINNLGDPYIGSHYASEVCELEREVIAWLMELWECDAPGDFWGSVGASGTEGNLWALYLAREAFPEARLLFSREAHYSIPKAARILRIDSTPVDCTPDGAIDIEALAETLAAHSGGPLIVALTCGTTVKGAHDDIAGALACLDAAGLGPDRRFIHIDGALNAMVLPFVEDAPQAIRPSFRHAIDSISTSGHKMIGTPMPCGVLIARRCHSDRVASAVAYLRSNDTTLMGSRNGHAVLAIWSRLHGHGAAGYRADIGASLTGADRLAGALRAAGVPVLRNPYALTLLFPEPSESIVRTYQLACYRGEAHAIVMPSVTDTLLDRFLDDYLAWWRCNAEGLGPSPACAPARAVTAPPKSRANIPLVLRASTAVSTRRLGQGLKGETE
jgi:histidine decarboxylase